MNMPILNHILFYYHNSPLIKIKNLTFLVYLKKLLVVFWMIQIKYRHGVQILRQVAKKFHSPDDKFDKMIMIS